MTLLHKATHSMGEWSWQTWLDRLGVDVGKRNGGELRFAEMGLVLSAAVDGAGIALSRSLLVHDALCTGRLTIPINTEPMMSTKKHVARWRKDKAHDPDINAFVSWLVSEAATTLKNTDELIRNSSSCVNTGFDDTAIVNVASVRR
jgi:LysR family glycine cleavage system transcriptional activator